MSSLTVFGLEPAQNPTGSHEEETDTHVGNDDAVGQQVSFHSHNWQCQSAQTENQSRNREHGYAYLSYFGETGIAPKTAIDTAQIGREQTQRHHHRCNNEELLEIGLVQMTFKSDEIGTQQS
ncbi:MAG: hypothetical protein BWY75_02857 [bacterium ADurb.Bin425]|nr:MAG: hypothetical protein BWY75_02857 [bacterium ADurb.Bin425]